jgi:predicted anti-sigma-YlaC factor YlaD
VADPRRTECPFEGEVVAAAMAGRSPGQFDAELRAHLGTCPSCREVADISAFLSAERTASQAAAPLPSADLVWWRAQRRARLEAARAAEAPVRTAQLVATVGAVLLVSVLGWWVFGSFGSILAELRALVPAPADALRPDAAPLVRGTALLALLAAVVFVPVALYLAFVDE